jgi:tetratricopeptide (TPR) repeat protein
MVASEALGKMMDSQRQGEAGQNSKGFTLADQCIQAVQQLPDLSPNIAATVHGLLGFRYRLDDRDDEAQEMLETALALGECSGFVLNQEGLYAELLAGLYDVAALSQVQTEQFDEAATTVSKLSALVERFQRHQEFHLLKHRSALLLCKGDILWLRGEFDAALRLYRELIEPPLVEYLASEPSLRWVLGTSHAQIGLVNLRGGHLQEAILFLQEALSYFDPTDKRFRRSETLLNEAKSQEAAAY